MTTTDLTKPHVIQTYFCGIYIRYYFIKCLLDNMYIISVVAGNTGIYIFQHAPIFSKIALLSVSPGWCDMTYYFPGVF